MYVATMEYPLVATASPSEAAAVWTRIVADEARGRPGLVRLQLFSGTKALLAVGTWTDKSFAEDFMKTGVFIRLKEALSPYLAAEPQPRLWTQETLVEGRP